MTLLNASSNRKRSQDLFKQKCNDCFSQSELEINRKLLDYQEWNPGQIENRQQKMAEIACNIWRIDI